MQENSPLFGWWLYTDANRIGERDVFGIELAAVRSNTGARLGGVERTIVDTLRHFVPELTT